MRLDLFQRLVEENRLQALDMAAGRRWPADWVRFAPAASQQSVIRSQLWLEAVGGRRLRVEWVRFASAASQESVIRSQLWLEAVGGRRLRVEWVRFGRTRIS
jgi:hypothetical protein